MRLKKLKIVGFKSFADKVSIDFDREIIGIVGPNGCGKSNIVDAFRWVLGEQSVKSMRASSMSDVLFAGTSGRAPLHYAEVSITLSDVSEVLNTPYEEVTITRRLYRNGDSEYRLNKEVVRLRDIQHLLLGSGVGKNAFSIFEQGKIDHVIHLHPQNRRSIFDEAAGIGLFLEKKKDTTRKLHQVSENFQRIQDVYNEVEKQASTLKKQAKLAQAFQENQARLLELERALLAHQLRELQAKGATRSEEARCLKEEKAEIDQSIAALRSLCEKEKGALQTQEKEHQAKKERLYQIEKSYEVQKVERKRTVERHVELQNQLQSLYEERKVLSIVEEDPGLDLEVEKSKAAHSDLEVVVNSLYVERKKLEKEYVQALQNEKKLHEKEFLEKEIDKHEKSLARLQEEVEKRKEKNQVLRARSERLKEEWQTLSQQVQETRSHIDDLRHKIAELSAREKVYSGGEQKLLKVFPDKLRPLLEAITPLKGYERALDALLYRYADTLLVKTQEDAKEVLEFAKRHKIDHFSLLPLDTLRAGKNPLARKGVVAEHFNIQLFEELRFGECGITKDGLFVDHFGVVFQTPFSGKVQLATVKEEKLEAVKKLEKLQAQLQDEKPCEELWRKEEMRSVQENFLLQQNLHELKKEEVAIEKLQKKLKQLGEITIQERGGLQTAIEKIDLALEEKRAELQELAKAWRLAEREAVAFAAKKQAKEERKVKIDKEIDECEKSRTLCEKSMRTREESIQRLEKELQALLPEFEERNLELEKRVQELAKKEALLREQRDKERQTETKLHQLEVFFAAHDAQVEELKKGVFLDDVPALKKSEEETKQEIRSLKGILEKNAQVNMLAIGEYAEVKKRADFLKEQTQDLENAKKELEKIIVRLDHESRKIFKKTFEEIRKNFQKNFSILFNGGEADLQFTDHMDVLEAGVEIVVKPPGKKLKAISLLSGGEKCLTALALLFALFEVKRAPFCILDEVDAPLDDTNIGRFTEMLRQFTDQTQFIIVTHNKKTMSIADILIGVSMEEKGVSKLISLAFTETQTELIH